uniref:RT_RNaseH_2 domain-containing protein n=1 Tax=Strongyloides venezuelensis TaxID=75913 RepID=A0A0K0FRW0_STRVS
MSYALCEINHQFRRSGETPAAKFYEVEKRARVYIRYFLSKLGHRILMIQDCFEDVHAVSKDFTHSQGKECYTDFDDSNLDNLLDISIETLVPGDVGYTSDPDEAGFLSQFEAVFDHDDGLPHPKNDDVADDELSLMIILEKELQSPETDTIAFIDESSYSEGGYGILLYHRNDLNENFAVETISKRNIKCGAAKPTGERMEILALQKILKLLLPGNSNGPLSSLIIRTPLGH